ncbi:MAG: DUF2442 domain-containing protein [Paludibacter sp.]
MFTEVTHADYIGDYKVSVLFNDGVKKSIDFYNLLFVRDYPVFRPLKNIDVFKNFKVTDTLEWENGTIDIAPETIYELGVFES